MAKLTQEQIELINQIRNLQQKENQLDYEQTYLFHRLIDQAEAQNLCWW